MTSIASNQLLQVIQLSDGENLAAEILPFGAIIKSIKFKKQEMTLSVDDPQYYLENPFYLGATVGRYANRIAKGRFSLSGTQYQLEANNGPNSLHGGVKGFNKVLWQVTKQTESEVELYYCSPDGEQGFPGELQVWQTISAKNGELTLHFKALTNKETLVNFTNHCYFNLDGSESINEHLVQINTERYLPIDTTSIPLNEAALVCGTCFDFTKPAQVGEALSAVHPQLEAGNGFDHCYIFNDDSSLKTMATLTSPHTNVSLTLKSTQPGMQLYTANFVGSPFKARQALCFEAQNWPDAPNRENFPKANLLPAEKYEQVIIYAFSE
ncbi:galactose mutarotase [Pseudoalteromonas sp. SR43-6]|uniref:aldose epimerase family protein n=1 Tax=unclassified Pseudoalteromonas TaxID=194690 RepID=UPI0015F7AD2F|nr:MULTISPECIES: aldose epimerase family protein [unclassified Pseudoalteromonas]MBB1290015.1 galactose mutarotase [Pseudoalteromonas sp. SR41-5]MBB1375579.1 galactose mutarotase [Pseudoalteromonas sp. SR43-6]MBB1414589.1 galactose mutarotase [Pseudoalteromonas sp. SG43-8]